MNNLYIPSVTKNLLIINVLTFLVLYVFRLGDGIIGYLPVYYFDSPFFRFWQPITYMFMHGGYMHILFNMFALYSFGAILEGRWGARRFLFFYLITGLGALGLQWVVQAIEVYQITGSVFNKSNMEVLNTLSAEHAVKLRDIYQSPMVGASGAIFGLLVAFGMIFPGAELFVFMIPVPIKAKYIIPIYIVIELLLGTARIEGDSVAHYAHLGGALIGFILVKLWKANRFYDYYE